MITWETRDSGHSGKPIYARGWVECYGHKTTVAHAHLAGQGEWVLCVLGTYLVTIEADEFPRLAATNWVQRWLA